MPLSPENKKLIEAVLFKNEVFQIVMEYINEHLDILNNCPIGNDLFKDIPEIYKTEGKKDILRIIKSDLELLEKNKTE